MPCAPAATLSRLDYCNADRVQCPGDAAMARNCNDSRWVSACACTCAGHGPASVVMVRQGVAARVLLAAVLLVAVLLAAPKKLKLLPGLLHSRQSSCHSCNKCWLLDCAARDAGACVGAGVDLVTACDMRYCTSGGHEVCLAQGKGQGGICVGQEPDVVAGQPQLKTIYGCVAHPCNSHSLRPSLLPADAYFCVKVGAASCGCCVPHGLPRFSACMDVARHP
jgi:hypothetical protein